MGPSFPPAACLAVALLLSQGCKPAGGPQPSAAAILKNATYVGAPSCFGCHAREAELWKASHHALAMQKADEKTVLGDFQDAGFRHAGVTTTFSRRDGRFFVRTDGADGRLQDFPVEYTFGVEPLQQYLVPAAGGRYQALSIAWDARPTDRGGRRWFHLYPDEEVPAGDLLHWTGAYQNWNFMCAECHSTNLRKGYRVDQDRYETSWTDLSVGCEACHGPGSEHVAWAKREPGRARGLAEGTMGLTLSLKDTDGGSFLMERKTGIAKRSPARTSHVEVETCARCHARRGALTDDYVPGRPIMDTHRVALLDEELYYPDGQILGEVYEYGSFLQSKMHAGGVTCHDCHDPHSAGLVASGNAVCARCHLPGRFDTPSHHHHAAGSAGSRCVTCHMPTKQFMGIDARHDHSIRIPRPDLTLKIGSPNACAPCHADRPARWAAEETLTWWGSGKLSPPHYGEVIDAGRRGLPGAGSALSALATDTTKPAIVRGTAASLLGSNASTDSLSALRAALRDPEPLVRAGALLALEGADRAALSALAAPLLADRIRSIRVQAAGMLAGISPEGLGEAERKALTSGLQEYRATQEFIADSPEGALNLGLLDARTGQTAAAEQEYRRAIRMAPGFAPAYVNLADLYRALGRDGEGEQVLREGMRAVPGGAALHHALGLLLVREKKTPQALVELKKATELDARNPRFAYVYAVALESSGRIEQALAALRAAHAMRPSDRDVLIALATFSRKKGDVAAALAYARQLAAQNPADTGAQQLLQELGAAGS